MKVLITGSEGFIGSHLVEELVKSGHSIRCFVLYNSFNSLGWLTDCNKKILKNQNFVEDFTYANYENKSDLIEYQREIKNNITNKIIEEILLYMNLE